uniref:Uma2 family endonuclease n=1 Tax=Acetatifactor sp. TaxID=1872090 RepID=UPI0040561351
MEAYVRGDEYVMSKGTHTIEEIYALPEGERAELIDGELYMMASPSTIHQMLVTELLVEIVNYIKSNKGNCKVFTPIGVFLHNDDRTYVEPDIVVICEKEKLDNKGCHGAPDWAIEIVSPSSKKMDYVIKLTEYQKAGVREYWIVDPLRKVVTVYALEKDAAPVIYHFTDIIPVGIYEEFAIDFAEIELPDLDD